MELDTDRRYRFPVQPDVLWSAIAETDDYPRWWPWLVAFEASDGLVTGGVWRSAVRPPLPYTLRFAIHLVEVVPTALVQVGVSGDITGTARIVVAPDDEGCEVRLTSSLAPSSGAFSLIASVARPIVRRGHDWVLDTGASQFLGRAVGRR